mmetsp:Transcript_101591/g.286465  ORF Transcript_101591/g.286465 Transcript_101591/m.286465 type:complete len:454 (-) Transcript_101591:640-2001(-)
MPTEHDRGGVGLVRCRGQHRDVAHGDRRRTERGVGELRHSEDHVSHRFFPVFFDLRHHGGHTASGTKLLVEVGREAVLKNGIELRRDGFLGHVARIAMPTQNHRGGICLVLLDGQCADAAHQGWWGRHRGLGDVGRLEVHEGHGLFPMPLHSRHDARVVPLPRVHRLRALRRLAGGLCGPRSGRLLRRLTKRLAIALSKVRPEILSKGFAEVLSAALSEVLTTVLPKGLAVSLPRPVAFSAHHRVRGGRASREGFLERSGDVNLGEVIGDALPTQNDGLRVFLMRLHRQGNDAPHIGRRVFDHGMGVVGRRKGDAGHRLLPVLRHARHDDRTRLDGGRSGLQHRKRGALRRLPSLPFPALLRARCGRFPRLESRDDVLLGEVPGGADPTEDDAVGLALVRPEGQHCASTHLGRRGLHHGLSELHGMEEHEGHGLVPMLLDLRYHVRPAAAEGV